MALLKPTLYQVDGSDIELVLSVSNDMNITIVLVLLNAAGIILVLLATHSVLVDGGIAQWVWMKEDQRRGCILSRLTSVIKPLSM
jgi:hypothetical protein